MRASNCIFDVQGNVLEVSRYASVTVVADMLIIEFLNGLIIPFMIKKRWFGRYDLYIMGKRVMKVRKLNEPIQLIFEDYDRSDIRFYMIAGLTYHSGRVHSGSRVVFDNIVFMEDELYEWADSNGVVRPVGCAYTIDDRIVEHGCGLIRTKGAYIVSLPNGYKFPIFRLSDSIGVLSTVVSCDLINFVLVAVRVSESSENSVRFDVRVFDSGKLTEFVDIVYDESGARCGSDFVSTRQLTKQMVLGG